ncbi:MAG: SBBP repeat-containing protein, partial [Hormoscilla sp. GUM202]|nr:SBBP repeat-containing protein [Hormoscilla sp. GUM202]
NENPTDLNLGNNNNNFLQLEFANSSITQEFQLQNTHIATDSNGNAWITGTSNNSIDIDRDGKIDLISVGGRDSYVAKFARDGTLVFALTFGASQDDDYGRGIATDSNGNVWATGSFSGNIDIGNDDLTSNGGRDSYVVKFNSNGTLAFALNIGGGSDDQGIGIATDSNGNAWATGSFSGNIDIDRDGKIDLISNGGTDSYVAKFDSNGDFLGASTFGSGSDDQGIGIATDSNGNVWATGSFSGNIGDGNNDLISNGGTDSYVANFDSNGTLLKAFNIGSNVTDVGYDIATDSNDNAWATGRISAEGANSLVYVAKFNSDGDFVKTSNINIVGHSFHRHGIATDSNGNVWATGSFSGNIDIDGDGNNDLTSNGHFDSYVAKLNSNGDFLGALALGGSSKGYGIAADSSGNVWVIGEFHGNIDIDGDGNNDLTNNRRDGWNTYILKFSDDVVFIDENVADLVVGTFSTTDPDTGDTSFTYQLVPGMGDTDNTAFTIDGNQLRIKSSPDPDSETKSSYSIRVQTTDAGELSYSENFTININDVNENPTDLDLNNNSINENVTALALVGTFSTTDPDTGDTSFTYQLVDGVGGTDNAAFTILGDQLQIKSSPDFETQSSYSIRVRTEDAVGLSYSENFTININDVNENPTDLDLSNNSINENVTANTLVGTFSTTDPDTGDTSFTYQLVDGVGGTDNAAFTILGDQLQIKSSPDFETQSSYSIRVRTEDAVGLSYSENFTININDVNENPTDLDLSNNSINENVTANTLVGTFSTTDPDTGDTSFTYQLVDGVGGTDNAAFTILGDQLQIKSSPDFETQSSYSIRVRTEDAVGLSYSENFTININDVNENPTDLDLSNNSINENVTANTLVGTFSTTDPDTGDTSFTYQLVDGVGGTDNAAFTILGDQLQIKSSPDFETQSSYSIRVRTEDAVGLSYSENFTININDVNENPTDLDLSNNSINENVTANTLVGTFSTTDPDTGDTSFTYQLVDGVGGTDNAAFTILGDQLQINSSPDFEAQSSYSIRVRTTDPSTLSYSKLLIVNINDVNEDFDLSNNSIDENVADLALVGTFSTIDPNTEDTFTYQLVDGVRDNAAFTIVGNQLQIKSSPDFETQSSYSIRVRTNDGNYSENFTININDVNDAPTDLNLSNNSVNEPINEKVQLEVLTNRIGGINNDWGLGIATDSNGNAWATGYFSGSIDIDGDGNDDLTSNGLKDAYVAKFDSNGTLAFALNIGGGSDDHGNGIATDSNGNAWATGYFSGSIDIDGDGNDNLTSNSLTDAYVAKFNSNGTLAFAENIGGSNFRQGYDIAIDSNGHAWTTGLFWNRSNSSYDSYVAKFDSNGDLIFAKNIGGSAFDHGWDIAIDSNGHAWTTGEFSGNIDIDGDGNIDLTSNGLKDAYVAKFDSNGDLIFALNIGGSASDIGRGIATDSNGNVWATGSFSGSIDINGDGNNDLTSNGNEDAYVAKFDSNGTLLKALSLGGSGLDHGNGIATDSNDNAWATGPFQGSIDIDGDGNIDLTSNGLKDAYVAKFDSNGTLAFALNIGGGGFDDGWDIATDSNGNAWATGSFQDFTSNGGHDSYVFKFSEVVIVGTFSTTDPDTEDTSFTYQLVPGMGDTDNAAFTIVGDELRIYGSPDFETKSSYSIRVRTTDADGQSYEENLTININDVNENPTDLNLSNNSINENVLANTVVGTFLTTDPDTEDTSFTYQLVAGMGDTDNAAFTIVGSELRIKSSPDFETQSSYSIRVRTEDASGLSYSENFTININDSDVNDPTDLSLSNNSIDENVADLVVGTFSTTDPDTGDTFTYQLVAGMGDTDNAAFTILGDQLQIKSSPDFETQSSYSIRVRTEDAVGQSYSENFTININDVNEALAPMNRMAQSPALDAVGQSYSENFTININDVNEALAPMNRMAQSPALYEI